MRNFLTDGDLIAFDVLVTEIRFGTLPLDESEKAGLVQAGWDVSNFPVSVSKREYTLSSIDAYGNAALSFRDATSASLHGLDWGVYVTPVLKEQPTPIGV